MKRFILIDGSNSTEGCFHVLEEGDDSIRRIIFTGDNERDAFSKIIESAGVKVDVYSNDEFYEAFVAGAFDPVQDGSGGTE